MIRHLAIGLSVGLFANGPLSVVTTDQPHLLLPFPSGTAYMCTQGPGGVFSHHTAATKNDLDFDTPNNSDQPITAAAPGTAYVHPDRGPKSFGNHISIDHGNGYF